MQEIEPLGLLWLPHIHSKERAVNSGSRGKYLAGACLVIKFVGECASKCAAKWMRYICWPGHAVGCAAQSRG
jgi:hypothetical protein